VSPDFLFSGWLGWDFEGRGGKERARCPRRRRGRATQPTRAKTRHAGARRAFPRNPDKTDATS